MFDGSPPLVVHTPCVCPHATSQTRREVGETYHGCTHLWEVTKQTGGWVHPTDVLKCPKARLGSS